MKNLITTGFVVFTFYSFWNVFYQIGPQHSADGAAGFLLGLLFMAALLIQIKCVRYLCDVIKERLAERNRSKLAASILEKMNKLE